MIEGFDFIGFEQDAEYCQIAEARISFAQELGPNYDALHGKANGAKKSKQKTEPPQQIKLTDLT